MIQQRCSRVPSLDYLQKIPSGESWSGFLAFDRLPRSLRLSEKGGASELLQHLYQAQIVFGILTAERNPNVCFELRIAHATQPLSRRALIAEKGYLSQYDTKDLIFMQLDPGHLAASVDSLDELVDAANRDPRECM